MTDQGRVNDGLGTDRSGWPIGRRAGGENGTETASAISNRQSYPQAESRGKLHTRCTLQCDQKTTKSLQSIDLSYKISNLFEFKKTD